MPVEKTNLENQLTIATDTIDNFETVSIGMFINIGAVNENENQIGVSHFLEHMAFKGTTSRAALQISREIESVGGIMNACTGIETTAFYVKVLKNDVELAVDIITDILQNSTFDAEEFEKERGVIIQEIRKINDTPDDLIFDMFQKKCFDGERLGTSIIGTENNIRSVRREVLKDYLETKYSTDKMILAACGGVRHEEIVALAQKFASSMKSFETEVVEPQKYKGGFIFKKKKLEQSHLILGFEGVNHKDEDSFSIGVMSTILGGGMSSRLFQEIREKRGLAYAVLSFNSRYRDTGTFGIYAACEDNKVSDTIKIARDEVQKLARDVTEEELKKAKTQMKAATLMALENSSSRMERLAEQFLLRQKFLSPKEISQKIDEVTIDDIKRVVNRIFKSKPTLAVIGNGNDIEKLYDIF
ncbi:MAG: insulinase family protein [Holosporales bacterium]|jgi:predicted Zn-dependent peptidase|nr:insulinase family protein [Holosporales bacterium]